MSGKAKARPTAEAEAPAESADVAPSEATSAAVEPQAVLPEQVTCGPLTLKRQGTGYRWAQSHVGHPPPQPAVRVVRDGNGWRANAGLGQAGLLSTKETHSEPQQAAAQLEAAITKALRRAREHQRLRSERVRANALDRASQPQADRDLEHFARAVGWPDS